VSGKKDMAIIVSFFHKNKLKSKKQRDFLLFRKALLSDNNDSIKRYVYLKKILKDRPFTTFSEITPQ
jgi:hypothetical protein